MTFDEHWQPTEEYVTTTTEYERQRDTWFAAMRAAAEDSMEELSARDYFAGLALSNLCSHSIPKGQVDVMAEFAYCLAEAMLRERAKRNSD